MQTGLEVSAADPSWQRISSLFANFFLQNGIGLVLLTGGHAGYIRRLEAARFFGTAAPLIVGALLVVIGCSRAFGGFIFLLVGLPFLILFMAGVSTDLLEGPLRAGRQHRHWRRPDRQRHD